MSNSAIFLGGVKDRLLPVSIPFRFFVTAVGFHVLFWVVLMLGTSDVPGFVGGTGPVLAAIHLATLGVLAMVAMGAAFQLLPVATRQPLSTTWPARLCYWLFAPGTLILTFGMAFASQGALYIGGGAVSAGLLVFGLLTADNLRRAGSLPIVAAHGWLSLGSLVGLVIFGLLLILDYETGILPDHQAFAVGHLVLASFGFMGALVFGFSYVLIPMFAMSRALPDRIGWLELSITAIAILLGLTGLLSGNQPMLTGALLFAGAAAGAYLWQMQVVVKGRMKKRLGPAFVMIRASWGLLAISVLTGLVVQLGVPIPNGVTLFGFLMLAGWLLTFLMGVLQRIMPFLGSMHASSADGRPVLVSTLTAQRPLDVHGVCHLVALGFCSAGIVLNSSALVLIGAGVGLMGALAFAAFTALVVVRLRG